jgi:hypothetical protein
MEEHKDPQFAKVTLGEYNEYRKRKDKEYEATLLSQEEWQRDFAGCFEGVTVEGVSIRLCVEKSLNLALILARAMRQYGDL